MPTWNKVATVDALNETARAVEASGIKEYHPRTTPEQAHRILADILIGRRSSVKVYGHAECIANGATSSAC